MMKTTIFFILLIFSLKVLNAQDPVDRIWMQIDSVNKSFSESPQVELPKSNPWSYNTTVGTSFSYAPRLGSAMNMMVAPHVNYVASNRLNFHGGVIASHSTPVMYQSNGELPMAQDIFNMSVFVATSYRLTENLIIHGTGMKSLMVFPGDIDYPSRTFDDLSVGATYKFGNFSIGASIHSAQNPFIGSPMGFGNNMYRSPLYW